MGRKRGRKVGRKKTVQSVNVDLSIVKEEPVEPITQQTEHVDVTPVAVTPVARKSTRIKERERKWNEAVLKSPEVLQPKVVNPPSIKLQVLDFKVEEDSDQSDLPFDLDAHIPPPPQKPTSNTQVSSSGADKNEDVIVPLPSGYSIADLENMPHQDAVVLLKKYMDNYVLDQEHIKALRKNNEQQTRSVGVLIDENDKLKKSAQDCQVMSEAERWRAEDAWRKLESTKLYNKASEEGELQRHFLRNKYEDAINEIKSGCEKRLKELEKDRSMLARENSTHVNNMLRMKKSYSKIKNKLDQLKTLVRIFSSTLDILVDITDLKDKLSCFGTPFIKRYSEALGSKPSIKELNFAKRIANVSPRVSPISINKSEQIPDTSDSDSIDEFLDVLPDPFRETISPLHLNSHHTVNIKTENTVMGHVFKPHVLGDFNPNGDMVKPKVVDDIIKPNAVGGMVKPTVVGDFNPNAVDKVFKPTVVDDLMKPKVVGDFNHNVVETGFNPKVVDDLMKPKVVRDFNPNVVEKVFNPNTAEIVFKPTVVDDIIKSTVAEKVFNPNAVDDRFNPKVVDDIIKPNAAEKVYNPKEVDDMLNPKVVNKVFNPKVVDDFNRNAVDDMLNGKAVLNVIPQIPFRTIKEEKESPPVSPPTDDDPYDDFPDRDSPVPDPVLPTIQDVVQEYSQFSPVSAKTPSTISSIFDPDTPFQYVKKERITPPLTSMPFNTPVKIIEEQSKSPSEDETQIKIPIICTKPKMWGKKMVSYNPGWELGSLNPPPAKRTPRFPFLPPDYGLSQNFKLVSPIVTPPCRPQQTINTLNQSNDLVIEFPIRDQLIQNSTLQTIPTPVKAEPDQNKRVISDKYAQFETESIVPSPPIEDHEDDAQSLTIADPDTPEKLVIAPRENDETQNTKPAEEIRNSKISVEEMERVVIPSKNSAFQSCSAREKPNQDDQETEQRKREDIPENRKPNILVPPPKDKVKNDGCKNDLMELLFGPSETKSVEPVPPCPVSSTPKRRESKTEMSCSKLFVSDSDGENVDKEVEKASYEIIKLIDNDSNPFITQWDSDKSERFTPPIILLPRGKSRGCERRNQPPRDDDNNKSLRSRLNERLSIMNPAKSGLGCEKLRLETQIREAKKRARASSSSDESSVKKKRTSAPKYTMTDLFGDDLGPPKSSQVEDILSDEYAQADNESNDCSEEEANVTQTYVDDLQPPASPDPDPVQPPTQSHFQVDQGLVSYVKQVLEMDIEMVLTSRVKVEEVDEEKLAVALYKAIVETEEHEYLAHVMIDERISPCPLIPRFQTIMCLIRKLEKQKVSVFLNFFINHVIPNDNERDLENDQFLVNMGRLMGAITLCLEFQSEGLEMLFNFLLYRPPFAYSFAHGLLCSDSSVIGYTGFWQFEDLCKKNQAILFSIFKHPRFGDARYATPVIEMIKRSLSMNVPDITFDQFLWKTVEHTFQVESDRELNKSSHVIAMLLIQKGIHFFTNTYVPRFSDWIQKWSRNVISDGVIACLINTVGIVADALRRNDIPESTVTQQGVLKAIGNITNAPKLIQDVVKLCVNKLEEVVLKRKNEEWYYEKKYSAMRGSKPRYPPRVGSRKKKFKKIRDGQKVGVSGGFKKIGGGGTWVRGKTSKAKSAKTTNQTGKMSGMSKFFGTNKPEWKWNK